METINPKDLTEQQFNDIIRWAFLTEETNKNYKGMVIQLQTQLKQRNKRIKELKQLLLNHGIQVV